MGQIDDDIDRWLEGADESDDYEAPEPPRMGIMKTLSARPDEDPEFRAYQTMSRNDDTTTIGAILEMEPGSKDAPQWVNGDFEATVNEAKVRQTKAGQPMITGTLVDPDTGASVAFSAFGRKAFPPAGSLVRVSGQGISLGAYNDNPQLTLGQKAVVNVLQAAPNGQRATAAPGAIFGATVGMAVNNACELALEEWKADESAQVDSTYWRRVWDHASQILRIAAVLEKGKLAPNPAKDGDAAEAENEPEPDPEPEPEAPPPRQPPRAASRPQPGPGGSVAHDDIDPEDVPF